MRTAERTGTPDVLETLKHRTAPSPVEPATTPDLLDITGRRRSPATYPGFAKGRPPRNKGRKYPPRAPSVAEIFRFISAIDTSTPHGRRLQALTVVAWRSGLRVAELCDLEENDLDRRDYAITVRSGKGGKRRVSAMDDWGWEQLQPWLAERREYPVGALFPVLNGPTAGRPLATTVVRAAFRKVTAESGLRVRITPHWLRHAHAVELWREGIDIFTISRQLGHGNAGVTADYLVSLAPLDLLEPIGHRKPPTMPFPNLTAAA